MGRRFLPPAQAAQSAYARPVRTAKAVTQDETEAAANIGHHHIDAWCDTYIARLAKSTIKTKSGRKKEVNARTSATDSAILGALCSQMRKKGCGCFEATEQQIAELASMAENTVAASMRRLENEAYLVRHPAAFGAATRYSLVVEKLAQIGDGVRNLGNVTGLESLAEGDLSDTAYRAKNLGKTAHQVYMALVAQQGQQCSDIAEEKGRHKSTVMAALLKLAELGMVYQEKKCWFISTNRIRTDDDLYKITQTCAKQRSERRAAREIERACERTEQLARLREDLDDTIENRHLWDSEDEFQESLHKIHVQIEEIEGAEADQSRYSARKADWQGTYERQVEARYRAYLACNRSLTSGNTEGGQGFNPIVYAWRKLQKV